MARPKGIDVSRWQGAIDWQAVAADGVVFAACRATIGDYYTDPQFAANWQGMKAAGIYRCAYHVLRPDIDVVRQINHFESTVVEAGDLPHVLDVEVTGDQSDEVIRAQTLGCLQEMEARFGRRPLVYTGDWFWTPHIGAQNWVDDYDLWVAHYYWPAVSTPKLPAGWMIWRIWQHSNQGSVAGIVGNVDLGWFGGRLDDLKAYAGDVVLEPGPPVPVTDIAIPTVNAPSSGVKGDIISVDVTVGNVGNQDVTGDIQVTLTDDTDSVTIGTQTISGGLAVGASTTLTFSWDTRSATLGDHVLTARHDFADDNAANNSQSTMLTVNAPAGLTVTSIDPNTMQAGTTMNVTIIGSGFVDGADVTFENGAGPTPTASNVVIVDVNTIAASVTAKPGGPPQNRVWDVRVTNPDGSSAVLVDGFTVTP